MSALREIVRGCAAVAVAVVVSGAAWAGANPPPQNYTFTFTGTCSDCGATNQTGIFGEGSVTATLNLQNYSLNTALTDGNFAGFTYHSDKLGTLTASSLLTGAGQGLTGKFATTAQSFADVDLFFETLNTSKYEFFTGVSGSWHISPVQQAAADIGGETSGIWNGSLDRTPTTSTPEPASLALLGAGLLALGVSRRRRA